MITPRHAFFVLGVSLFQAVLAGSALGGGGRTASLLDDYAVYRWQVEEGLPEDSVKALLFASDG